MKKLFLFFFLFLFLLYACSKNNSGSDTPVTCSGTPSFANDVLPLTQAFCATSGCHAAPGNGPGALTNYAQIFANRVSIRAAVSNGSMPKNASLTTEQKNKILCWIDGGAPQN